VIKTIQIDASAKASNFIMHLHLPSFYCSIKWKGFKGREFFARTCAQWGWVSSSHKPEATRIEIVEVCTTQIHKVSKVLLLVNVLLLQHCCEGCTNLEFGSKLQWVHAPIMCRYANLAQNLQASKLGRTLDNIAWNASSR